MNQDLLGDPPDRGGLTEDEVAERALACIEFHLHRAHDNLLLGNSDEALQDIKHALEDNNFFWNGVSE